METRHSMIKYIIFLTKNGTTVWLELWSKWCIYIWKGICVHLMNERIIAIYGKEKGCKIFHILITAIASKGKRPWDSFEGTFLDHCSWAKHIQAAGSIAKISFNTRNLSWKGLLWCVHHALGAHAKWMFCPLDFQGSQMWVVHRCTWLSDPDFNTFLTVIIFSFLFSEHFSFLLVSFTLVSSYLSKPLHSYGSWP